MNVFKRLILYGVCAATVSTAAFTNCLPEESDLFTGDHSENFIIRWEFQKLCKHVFDPRTNPFTWPTSPSGVDFNAKAVRPGDLIFVRDVDLFFAKRFNKIRNPFIMVTAGEMRDKVLERHLSYLDTNKVIAWFSVHPCNAKHPKFYAIPLGIFQNKKHYKQKNELSEYLTVLRKAPKRNKIYMNFGDVQGKKPERARVMKMLKRASFTYVVQRRIPFLEYLEEMAKFKFTLSPPGYAPDCYRTWEALLVGSIPIVKSSSMDSMFKDLPVLIVNDWTEITEDLLNRTYKKFSTYKSDIAPLYIEYWAEKIKTVRDDFIKNMSRGKE